MLEQMKISLKLVSIQIFHNNSLIYKCLGEEESFFLLNHINSVMKGDKTFNDRLPFKSINDLVSLSKDGRYKYIRKYIYLYLIIL